MPAAPPAQAPEAWAAMPTPRLIRIYAAGPGRLRQALAGLDPARLAARPVPGKWSIVEIVLHLADSEMLGAGRVRLGAAQPGATFFAYDQDRWAEAFAYRAASPERIEGALTLFTALRNHTLPVFETAGPAAWTQAVTHPERGLMTLRQLLESYAEHAERHLGQILALRERLGTPLALPALP